MLRSVWEGDRPGFPGHPGEVLESGPTGIVVKTADSALRITAIADVAEDGAVAETRVPRIRVGTRLLGGQERRLARLEELLAARSAP